MTTYPVRYILRGRLDAGGHLAEADEPLLHLQQACGGQQGGACAVPQLREIAAKALAYDLKLSRRFAAQGGGERVTGWVEARPAPDGGCELGFVRWTAEPLPRDDEEGQAARIRRELDRALPEFTARLDPAQRVLTVEANAPDLAELAARMAANPGRPWTEAAVPTGPTASTPRHWRLLDGAPVEVPGSARQWTARLEPLGPGDEGSGGFVLTLASDEALPLAAPPVLSTGLPSLGEELGPALQDPINRVLANAQGIGARIAGPLADVYAGYAGDVVGAAQHLLTLIEDIGVLESIESPDFTARVARMDLGEAARQACGILGARAHERSIVLNPPSAGERQWAIGEFRRVLQVLINLVGNAIAYSPRNSQVWIRLDRSGDRAFVTVADQGRGLTLAEQARVFDKFERLGRGNGENGIGGEGGSGLGLYIAARLARAMGGDLTLESAPGQGARFTLSLPVTD